MRKFLYLAIVMWALPPMLEAKTWSSLVYSKVDYDNSDIKLYEPNTKTLAELLGATWRLIELICILLLIIDVVSRMRGKALYFIHACRYIIVSFGVSASVYAGEHFIERCTRGFMSTQLSEFLDDMYTNYLGWHLTKDIKIFHSPDESKHFMFTNVAFIEQLILFILLFIWGTMKAIYGKQAMMSKVYHFVKSLFLIFFISFMYHILFWGGLWFKQHRKIGKQNEGNRNYFGYIFNFILIIFWVIVAFCLLYSMLKTLLDSIDSDKTVKTDYDRPQFDHERRELTDTQCNLDFPLISKINFLETIGLGKDCSTESVSHEFSYMHQEKAVLYKTGMAKWYNFLLVLRWFASTLFAIYCRARPKTGYIFFMVFDLIAICFTILCLRSFMNLSGILIVTEEVCLFFWHLIVLIFYVDQEDSDKGDRYEYSTVKGWMIFLFILYLIVMVIEVTLLFLGSKLCFKPKRRSTVRPKKRRKRTKLRNEGQKKRHFQVSLPEVARVFTEANQNLREKSNREIQDDRS